ncbi:hypothetical protein LTR66_015417, partial [Elasticomyces elasticus]
MLVVVPAPPALSGELALYHTTDPLLSNSPVLISYGPASTIAASSSRVQVHVFTPAGLQSYPRLAVSPNSPFYAAVNSLPREEQGDEVCRALAFGLSKYFAEIPQCVKDAWAKQSCPSKKTPSAFGIFGDTHVAMLASRMMKVDNVEGVIKDIQQALGEQTLSWIDVDVILPPASIRLPRDNDRHMGLDDTLDDDQAASRYGEYAPLINILGEPAFLPTSKLKRAPSRPISVGRSTSFLKRQKEVLRREMCELVDTEENYVNKMNDLVHHVAKDFRDKARGHKPLSWGPDEDALAALFPPSLDKILEANSRFLDAIRGILNDTEEQAIQDIEMTPTDLTNGHQGHENVDDTGILAFAKFLSLAFPKFADCYADYIQAHASFPQLLKNFTREPASSFSKRVQDTGEQRLMSMLIEPVQRLPRYNLYIDGIVRQLPVRHPALKILLRARDTISDICSRESP